MQKIGAAVGAGIGLVAAIVGILGYQGVIPTIKDLISLKWEDIHFSESSRNVQISGLYEGIVRADSIRLDGRLEGSDLLLVANVIDLSNNTLEAPGKSVVLLAREVKNGIISVSGTAGDTPGASGSDGGFVLVVALSTDSLIVRANGGAGMNGSDGEDGANGRNGRCDGFGRYQGNRPGVNGGHGSPGGNGGHGGRIILVLPQNAEGPRTEVRGATAGAGGRGGQGGVGGRGCTGLGGMQSNAANGLPGQDGLAGLPGQDGVAPTPKRLTIEQFRDLSSEIRDKDVLDNCAAQALLAIHIDLDLPRNNCPILNHQSSDR